MTLWNNKDAEEATGGNSTCNWEADGVQIDSRAVKNGDLFIAIIGENQDGHKYVKQALELGAAAVVSYIPEDVAQDAPLLVVKDTMEALWNLARFSRARFSGKIAMVTGSVGKTSTKEMLAHVLEHQGKVHATIGNLNNHYGLPLTMARMPKDADFAVLEVGMSGPNEISPLSVLAKPDAAVITNVEPVHLEFFEGIEGIADAKSEVFDGLAEGGIAVVNRDNAQYLRVKKNAESKGVANIVSFGQLEGCDYRLDEYRDTEAGSLVKANLKGVDIEYEIGIPGKHQALNSLAVLAIAEAIGGDAKKAAVSFADYQAKAGRGKRITVSIGIGEVMIIDDTYNASPVSVSAALDTLGNLKRATGRRAVVALGDMFELGDSAPELHANLNEKIVENNIDLVFTAGGLTQNLANNLPENIRAGHAEDSAKLAPKVLESLLDGDILMVKGSRGMRMENVVNYILDGQKKNAV